MKVTVNLLNERSIQISTGIDMSNTLKTLFFCFHFLELFSSVIVTSLNLQHILDLIDNVKLPYCAPLRTVVCIT